jgi:uncharacterized protein YbjT (DUF2867 family)
VILVTGATGTVGREVVAQLLVAGKKVRALTRNPSRAHLDDQVELVAGDFNQPETLAKAVEGVESIFSLAFGPQLAIQEASLAQAGRKAGARHIVKLSSLRSIEKHSQGRTADTADLSTTLLRSSGRDDKGEGGASIECGC